VGKLEPRRAWLEHQGEKGVSPPVVQVLLGRQLEEM